MSYAADVNQSSFAFLEQFDSLARKNAEVTFTQKDFE
jgi:hypothetical protein